MHVKNIRFEDTLGILLCSHCMPEAIFGVKLDQAVEIRPIASHGEKRTTGVLNWTKPWGSALYQAVGISATTGC